MPAPDWNFFRFDPSENRGHVESYFVKLNCPRGSRALWLRATVLAAEGGSFARTELWAVAFERGRAPVAVKQSYVWSEDHFTRANLGVSVGHVQFDRRGLSGSLENGASAIDFELQCQSDAAPFELFPFAAMYTGPFPPSKIVTPSPDSRWSGSYSVNGERVAVEGWRGMQGHNWGRRHPREYAWVHCNQWEGDDGLVFECVTARVRAAGVSVRPVTLACVRSGNRSVSFNGPLGWFKNRGSTARESYAFEVATRDAAARGEFRLEPVSSAGLVYENPDGTKAFCTNSKLAEGTLRLELAGLPAITARTKSAALEILSAKPNPKIAIVA